jgi:hypothetical protein
VKHVFVFLCVTGGHDYQPVSWDASTPLLALRDRENTLPNQHGGFFGDLSAKLGQMCHRAALLARVTRMTNRHHWLVGIGDGVCIGKGGGGSVFIFASITFR